MRPQKRRKEGIGLINTHAVRHQESCVFVNTAWLSSMLLHLFSTSLYLHFRSAKTMADEPTDVTADVCPRSLNLINKTSRRFSFHSSKIASYELVWSTCTARTKTSYLLIRPSKAYSRHDILGQNIQSSPLGFRGSSPQECFFLLMKIRAETDSIVHPSIFAILDGQSLQDDTVVLVDLDDNERVRLVRCEFKIACAKLNGYFIGDSGIDEDT